MTLKSEKFEYMEINDMENFCFEELLNMNCFSDNQEEQRKAADLLEKNYCCEIHCPDMDKSVLFAHHARGCTIVAAKLSKGVVIYQNVTLGSNMKYNRKKRPGRISEVLFSARMSSYPMAQRY